MPSTQSVAVNWGEASFFAIIVVLERRRNASRAFPPPFSNDSAKLEKSTVSQSHTDTHTHKKCGRSSRSNEGLYRNARVVRIPPTSTERDRIWDLAADVQFSGTNGCSSEQS